MDPPSLSRETLSSENVSLIASWVTNCQKNHSFCQQAPSPLPLRIIDVQSTVPVLIVTDGLKKAAYCALSYCWGLSEANAYDQQYMTTSKTIAMRMQGMPMEELPQTFRDAVSVTRTLGLRYLWIDSLCIIQDCEADMLKEIHWMGSTFGNATITISAINASNASSGFLARDPQPISFKHSYVGTPGKAHLNPPSPGGTWDKDVENTAWNQRAWTFQERILSHRVLHFAKNKVYFECRSGDTDEEGAPPRRSIYDPSFSGDSTLLARTLGYFEHFKSHGPRQQDLVYKAYYELAELYSKRKLSFNSDRARAFSAIVGNFGLLLGSGHCRGLWLNDMLHGLLWRCERNMGGDGSPASSSEILPLRPGDLDSKWLSWSWYSAGEQVRWPKRPKIFLGVDENSPSPRKQIMKQYIRYQETSSESPVTLQVNAYLTLAYHEFIPYQNRGKISVKGEVSYYPEFDNEMRKKISGKVWILRLPSPTLRYHIYDHGLVLDEAISGSSFTRVGVFRINSLMPRSQDGSWVKIEAGEKLEWVSLT
ncbi:uncharacterized protein PAC_17879 [Phialocephala subalpina]|uniref:Heterokaryon incompatibility domain-containing protein n=1 Tax=Phialocephala subalpina TaxID=576137 RepID=A0A1L7XSF6_9HELO|nr:uncharacterized protein PAC_17879 [Phialocephala subalpina]